MAAALNLLIVEDGRNSRDLLCEMLKLCGHTVYGVGTAEEGVALLSRTRFDALFADINLPGVSGIELAKTAVKLAPGITIVFASGYGFLLSEKTDFEFFLLPKPYGLQQVKYAIEHIAELENGKTGVAGPGAQ